MTPDEFIGQFEASPDWYVHRLDGTRETALVVALGRDGYRTASFLDDRAIVPDMQMLWVPLSQLTAAARTFENPRPLHFIWHAGHVGSTLLSRLLDEVTGVLSLREPLPLRTLAEAADAVAVGGVDAATHASRLDALLGTLIACWARGYAETRWVVVKATSMTARVAPLVLRRAPEARSVCLNVSLETFLATSLSHGPPVDLRDFGPERIQRLQSRFETPLKSLWSMSIGELGAMSWLTETLTQRDLAEQFGDRVISLDFDAVLADIRGSLDRVFDHFAVSPDDASLARLENTPVLGRYSKAPNLPYTPAARQALLDESRERHQEEIRLGLKWIEQLARSETSVADVISR